MRLTTWTGKRIDYNAPSPDQIDIKDIAIALSRECRYAGHVREFYSVAQHSALCSAIVDDELALEALLHDASEAYLKDIPSPLKALLPDYKAIEARFDKVIRRYFGLPELGSEQVKAADIVVLATEIRDLIEPGMIRPPFGVEPLKLRIVPEHPENARDAFLRRFNYLTKGN